MEVTFIIKTKVSREQVASTWQHGVTRLAHSTTPDTPYFSLTSKLVPLHNTNINAFLSLPYCKIR